MCDEMNVKAGLQGEVVEILIDAGNKDSAVIDGESPIAMIKILTDGEVPLSDNHDSHTTKVNTSTSSEDAPSEDDNGTIRADLAEVMERQHMTLDVARMNTDHDAKFAQRVRSRHSRGLRTARENIEDLCDTGTFFEYGRFRVAAQQQV